MRMKRDRVVRRCAPRRCSGASSGSHTLRTLLPVLLAPGAGCPVDDRRAQNSVTHVLHFSCMQELAWWQGDEIVFLLRIQCGHRQNFENGGSSSISPPSESPFFRRRSYSQHREQRHQMLLRTLPDFFRLGKHLNTAGGRSLSRPVVDLTCFIKRHGKMYDNVSRDRVRS